MNIFKKLGIYGLPEIKENAILASLFTGDPVLLIGKQGTAKTALSNRIGDAFRERSKREHLKNPNKKIINHISYDSSKINFEDLIGIPDPSALREGKTKFIESPMTIWDKDLVTFDEFNRQEPARQNNIFELIRSRTIMGIPTGTKWIINCMNPFGMAGTETLDEALVDRHTFFINIDDFTSLSTENRQRVIQHVGAHDAVARNMWGSKSKREFDIKEDKRKDNTVNLNIINHKLADVGDSLVELLRATAKVHQELEAAVGNSYATFVDRFLSTFTTEMQNKDWKVELSGRRAGMIYRALMAYRSIDIAKCKIDPMHTLPDLRETFKNVLRMSIPVGISEGMEHNSQQDAYNSINANVDFFSDFFAVAESSDDTSKARTKVEVIYELLTTDSIERKIELLINEVDDEVAKSQVWTEILDLDETDQTNASKKAVLTSILCHLMTIKPDMVADNIRHILAKSSRKASDLVSTYELHLTGHASLYAKGVKETISKYKDVFLKLQAMMLFDDFFSKQLPESKIKDIDFRRVQKEIEISCLSLSDMLEKILEEEFTPVTI